MTPDQVIADLRAENKRLRAEITRKQIQLEKAWKDRAEIHTRLRQATAGNQDRLPHLSTTANHFSPTPGGIGRL